ncbi:hypothetical protein EUGRSUZ_D01271 [Eucalyptus grandis]|uniref:Uncharacterized protein n=2 Tax=Eucalyptus grandis TaxID=71139 RepID=A0ACC3L5A0_EUCGR|nr:hypothetical protein EUGRSUZ_D01271 [Eucalyptus grandis]
MVNRDDHRWMKMTEEKETPKTRAEGAQAFPPLLDRPCPGVLLSGVHACLKYGFLSDQCLPETEDRRRLEEASTVRWPEEVGDVQRWWGKNPEASPTELLFQGQFFSYSFFSRDQRIWTWAVPADRGYRK